MAELADAHGSGPCEGSFMKVRILLSAPQIKTPLEAGILIFWYDEVRIRTWEGASVKPEAPARLPAASGPKATEKGAEEAACEVCLTFSQKIASKQAVESFYPHQKSKPRLKRGFWFFDMFK